MRESTSVQYPADRSPVNTYQFSGSRCLVHDAHGRQHRDRGVGCGRFSDKTGTQPEEDLSCPASTELEGVLESAARTRAL